MNRKESKELLWIARGGLNPASLDALKEATGEELGEFDPDDAQDHATRPSNSPVAGSGTSSSSSTSAMIGLPR